MSETQETELVSGAQTAAAGESPSAQIGSWGVDLDGRDPGLHPGEDFYRHAVGRWLDTSEIPADRSKWTMFAVLSEQAETQVREIVEELPTDARPGTDEQKINDLYRAHLDTDTIENLGLAPARPMLDAIDAAGTHEEVARLLGRPTLPTRSPIRASVTVDPKDPDRYVVTVGHGGLGLPDRDYYLRDDAGFAEIRAKYEAHIDRMLTLADQDDTAAQARSVLELETRLAQLHWPIAKRRERDLTYNLRLRDELDPLAPGFPWAELLGAGGIADQDDYVVRELDAVAGIGLLFRRIPVTTWRSYLTYHVLAGAADVLPAAFDDERFDFYDRTLNGQPQQRDRWKRALDAVQQGLGEAVGRLYVARHFPPESKEQVTVLVETLRRAYTRRIINLAWLSEPTKKLALEKLAEFRPKIGYPDVWRDYSGLTIRPGDAFGNAVRTARFIWRRDLQRLDQPTDRDEWAMSPQTVNAYYNPTFNEIVFPAAILQPPFFDPHADAAVNYGAIGGVIGHEMGHGFDDQGAKSDARGVLRTWWAPKDETAFKQLVDRLAVQYDAYVALPDLNLNGRLTLGENIGDLGGLSVAFQAYRASLNGVDASVLDGFTGNQRFFLSWAQVWRALMREESLRTLVMSDPHSPPQFRVNGVVRNMDPWYTAFDVQPDHALYLAPDARVRIW